MRRYVPGVKMSGCTSYIYSWVEVIIDAERTRGYSVYTMKKEREEGKGPEEKVGIISRSDIIREHCRRWSRIKGESS